MQDFNSARADDDSAFLRNASKRVREQSTQLRRRAEKARKRCHDLLTTIEGETPEGGRSEPRNSSPRPRNCSIRQMP
jgi:hypothetical protein